MVTGRHCDEEVLLLVQKSRSRCGHASGHISPFQAAMGKHRGVSKFYGMNIGLLPLPESQEGLSLALMLVSIRYSWHDASGQAGSQEW